MENENGPVSIFEPDECSQFLVDKFYLAILRGKLKTTRKFLDGGGASVEMKNRSGQTPLFFAAFYGHVNIVKLLLQVGADPNSRCTYSCCTPVHAACWSGNSTLLKMLLLAGGNLWLHDREGRAPRDWANLQANEKKRLGILSLITTFNQMAASSKLQSAGTTGTLLREEILGPPPSETQGTFRLPATLLRNTLAVFGMTCKGNCKDVGPLGLTRGNGFGQVIYGPEEACAATFSPVPLVAETELGDDPADESCLDQLLPIGVSYRCGSTTEMVPRRWHRTPVTIRRMKGNQPADLLIEELRNLRNLSHPGLLFLLAVCTTQQCESIQLIFEPIFDGSFHSRLHFHSESPFSLPKRLLILQQVCEAILYLHSKNLIHCSVSSHAVHLTSSSQAKLGCFETLSESPLTSLNSRAMHRKVPSSHWDYVMKWMSPELVRGESLTTLSDSYSFCCLVWEVCAEKEPWPGMQSKSISQMWFNDQGMYHGQCALPLNNNIPHYLVSLLELGLQPDIGQRRDFNLKWILRALRTKQELNSNGHSSQPSLESKMTKEAKAMVPLRTRGLSPPKPTRVKSSDEPPPLPSLPVSVFKKRMDIVVEEFSQPQANNSASLTNYQTPDGTFQDANTSSSQQESTGEGERCYYSGRRKVTVLDNTLATQTSFIACSSMLNDSAAGARAPLKFTTFSNKCE